MHLLWKALWRSALAWAAGLTVMMLVGNPTITPGLSLVSLVFLVTFTACALDDVLGALLRR